MLLHTQDRGLVTIALEHSHGEKGEAGPSLLHTMLEGLME